MFIGIFWHFTDSNKSEKVLFNLSLLPNIHPWCGRGHPGPGPQPGCISQHLALDRSRRDTAELPAKDTSERSQQLRCQDPRLPRHQVVSRHGNSHHVVLVWSVNSEIVSQLIWCLIFSRSRSVREKWVLWISVLSVMFGLLELHYAVIAVAIVWESWSKRSLPPSDLFEQRAIVVNLLFMTLHCSYFQFLIEWFSFTPSQNFPRPIIVSSHTELKYIFPDFSNQNSSDGEGSKGRYAYVQVRSSSFKHYLNVQLLPTPRIHKYRVSRLDQNLSSHSFKHVLFCGEVVLVVVAVVVSFDTDLPFTAALARWWPVLPARVRVCQGWDIFTDAESPLISLRGTGAVSRLSYLVSIRSLVTYGQRIPKRVTNNFGEE